MKKLTLVLAGSLLAAAASVAGAADLVAGQAAYQKFNCASCHGADGKTPAAPENPILAGQHADYLVHALKSYKRGLAGAPASSNIRKNPIMGAMATPLSDVDITNISGWLATLPTPLSIQK